MVSFARLFFSPRRAKLPAQGVLVRSRPCGVPRSTGRTGRTETRPRRRAGGKGGRCRALDPESALGAVLVSGGGKQRTFFSIALPEEVGDSDEGTAFTGHWGADLESRGSGSWRRSGTACALRRGLTSEEFFSFHPAVPRGGRRHDWNADAHQQPQHDGQGD